MLSKKIASFLIGLLYGSFLAISLLGRPSVANATVTKMEVERAYEELKLGRLILIDVRSKREWRATGIAIGSKPITIHDKRGITGFVDQVMKQTNKNFNKTIAVICASGVRSKSAALALHSAGYKKVINLPEGMLGNVWSGSGWIKKKLPVKKWRED